MAAVATINVTIRPTLTKVYISGDMWDILRNGRDNRIVDFPSDIVTADPDSGKLVIYLAASPLTAVDGKED